MKVGYFCQEMIFPIGIEMAGYIDRNLPSSGYLSPLEIHSIFLEDNREQFFINVFDLLGIPENFKGSEKKLIPIATHTHSAPRPDFVLKRIEYFSKIACENSQKSAVGLSLIEYGMFKTKDICNLRTSNEIEEIEGKILIFHLEDKKKIGIICYPCHPTVLGPENTLYSSDLAGKIREKLSLKFHFPFIFLNSYCGDISTHKTRLSRDPLEVERLGELVASQIELRNLRKNIPKELRFIKMPIKMPLKNISFIEIPKDSRALPGYKLAIARKDIERYRNAEIALFSIGDLKMLLLPFEIFYSTGLKIENLLKKYSEFNLVVCYALSYRPYIVPKGQYGTYEWYASPYSDDAEEKLLRYIEILLEVKK